MRLWRAKREAAAEVSAYIEQCNTTGRTYNARTHVAKQCRASDKVNKARKGK